MSSPFIEVEGFPELLAKLRLLSDDKDKRKEMLLILRQVSSITVKVAKGLAPVSKRKHIARGKLIMPENLKKSIGNITGKGANPTIYAGPRAKGVFNGWYGHFVHDGVNVYNKGYKRKRSKGANNQSGIKKRTTGNPFMTKAYNVTEGQVTDDANSRFTAFIQRRIDKLSDNV